MEVLEIQAAQPEALPLGEEVVAALGSSYPAEADEGQGRPLHPKTWASWSWAYRLFSDLLGDKYSRILTVISGMA